MYRSQNNYLTQGEMDMTGKPIEEEFKSLKITISHRVRWIQKAYLKVSLPTSQNNYLTQGEMDVFYSQYRDWSIKSQNNYLTQGEMDGLSTKKLIIQVKESQNNYLTQGEMDKRVSYTFLRLMIYVSK